MEAKTLEQKSEKINTLLHVAKEVNTIYFEKKEEKVEIIQETIRKLKQELENY